MCEFNFGIVWVQLWHCYLWIISSVCLFFFFFFQFVLFDMSTVWMSGPNFTSPSAEVAEMTRIQYELEYTEGISQRMRIPETLKVASDKQTGPLPLQQPLPVHTTLMEVPERIIVAGEDIQQDYRKSMETWIWSKNTMVSLHCFLSRRWWRCSIFSSPWPGSDSICSLCGSHKHEGTSSHPHTFRSATWLPWNGSDCLFAKQSQPGCKDNLFITGNWMSLNEWNWHWSN